MTGNLWEIQPDARHAWDALADVLQTSGPAPCERKDGEMWFPHGLDTAQAARAACGACPARVACLEFALVADERAGIWGGTDPVERKALLRGRRIAA